MPPPTRRTSGEAIRHAWSPAGPPSCPSSTVATCAGMGPQRTPTSAARRFGYAIGAVANLVMMFLIYVWPGWEIVPFLTDDTTRVLGLVMASLIVGVATNLVYMVADPPVLRTIGDVLSTGIAVAVITRTLRVFPFDFGDATFDWALVTRILLILLIIATSIGLVAQMVRLGKLIVGAGSEPEQR
jgi:hypothetical protein